MDAKPAKREPKADGTLGVSKNGRFFKYESRDGKAVRPYFISKAEYERLGGTVAGAASAEKVEKAERVEAAEKPSRSGRVSKKEQVPEPMKSNKKDSLDEYSDYDLVKMLKSKMKLQRKASK